MVAPPRAQVQLRLKGFSVGAIVFLRPASPSARLKKKGGFRV